MFNIFDCSNSEERPAHRETSLCPFENDIVAGLKKYSSYFDCKFVKDVNEANIIFTNDIFPEYVLKIKKLKIKRMDGIYWQTQLKNRNLLLNKAAKQADHVIFISNYSKNSFFSLYKNELKSYSVILNNVDNNLFYPIINLKAENKITFSACASNWHRPEKRFNEILKIAELFPEYTIYLIGRCDYTIPINIKKFGYIENYKKINKILNSTLAFINVSYRDAAPKTVCQAVQCRLPVIYANSGGVGELVDVGIPIQEENIGYIFENNPRELYDFKVKEAINKFISHPYKYLFKATNNTRRPFIKTMEEYFNQFRKIYFKQYDTL